MALRGYQKTLALNTLYEVTEKGCTKGSEQLKTNLFINSGSVNVYGSNSEEVPENLTDMVLTDSSTNVTALNYFDIIPKYIAITQNAGTTTELIISGVEINNLGEII